MDLALDQMAHFCGEGASVTVVDGPRLRLQPSDPGTARVEAQVQLQPSTHYTLSGRLSSEDGVTWGHLGVKNFDGQGAELERGSHDTRCTTVTLDFCSGPLGCIAVLYSHAWKQQSGAVLVDSIVLQRQDGQHNPTDEPQPPPCVPPQTLEPKYSIGLVKHDGYLAVPKALYVWNPGGKPGAHKWTANTLLCLSGKDSGVPWGEWTALRVERLVEFCKAHQFGRVIVFIGSCEWEWDTYFSQHRLPHESQFVRLFASLLQASIVPHASFYLNDDVNSLAHFERASDVVSSVIQFNQRHPESRIHGLDGDQEPAHITAEYVAMCRAMVERRDLLGQPLEIAISLKPSWLKSEAAVREVMQLLGSSMVMAYSSDHSVSHSLAKSALLHAAAADCGVSVAIESSFRAPPSDSHWDLITSNSEQFFNAVVSLDNHNKTHAQYKDLVVHDYEGYFKAVCGIDPIDGLD